MSDESFINAIGIVMTVADGATRLKECRHGRMLYLRRDMYVGRSLDLYGEFSELECALLGQTVGPGDVVIEVGANIGAHTVHLARRVGPNGFVLAFEPQRVIFQILNANLALNEVFNVRTFHAAAGSGPGLAAIRPLDYSAENNFGGVSLAAAGSGEEVPVVALDQFPVPSCQVLKIDVEGMEAEVLAGAGALIARHRPYLYVENDRHHNSPRLIAMITELGYDMWWHTPPLFNPDNFARVRQNVFGDMVSINLLGVPKEKSIVVEGLREVRGADDWWNAP